LTFSPGQRLRFERISVEQGLSHSTVACVLQDSRGFMWFGTRDGLNRYDGAGVQVYKHDPQDANSLGHNQISALAEDLSVGGGMMESGEFASVALVHFLFGIFCAYWA